MKKLSLKALNFKAIKLNIKNNIMTITLNRPKKKNAMNMYGLYIRPKDIQQYIKDYTDYGIDYFGEDNECADDKIDRYWDEPEGSER